MQINQGNLPNALYAAICNVNAKYDKGNADYSVTQLIDSPRISELRKKHWNEIEENAEDLIWRFFGSIAHEIIANQPDWNVLHEERMYSELDGITISGCPDYFNGITIDDYKITSKYSIANGVKDEWIKQLNVYRYILADNKWNPEKLQITAICRDAGKDDPKVVILPVEMWTLEQAETYIRTRIQLHEQAKQILPFCTEEERWYSERKYAVMKDGNKRALKLFNLKLEANVYMKSIQEKEKKKIYIEERPGIPKRCEKYCNVSKFCTQYQSFTSQQGSLDIDNDFVRTEDTYF